MHVEARNVGGRMNRGRGRNVTAGNESCPARFDGPLQRRVVGITLRWARSAITNQSVSRRLSEIVSGTEGALTSGASCM
jgi:hypothetical protein